MESATTNWAHLLARHTRTLLQDNWMAAGAVDTGATAFPITTADHAALVPILLASQANAFAGATLEWTTGANAGVSTTLTGVATVSGVTTVTVADALPHAIADGDTFAVYAGQGQNVLGWAYNGTPNADTNALAADFVAPGNGTLRHNITLIASGAAATVAMVRVTPTSGATGASSSVIQTLNAGAALSPGDLYGFTTITVGGLQYNWQTSVSQQVIWDAIWTPSR